MSSTVLTRAHIFQMALPVMAANIATPLVGLVDTAVIGRTGDVTDLAAIALGSMIANALLWPLAFLRMGSTALAAQADGAAREDEVRATLVRGVLMGLVFGLALILLQIPLIHLALLAFSGESGVEAGAQTYLSARLWGAPAALASFAIHGWLIGLGRTGWSLVLQAIMNIANVILSVWLVFELDWGLAGVGGASAMAQWIHLLAAGFVIALLIKRRGQSGIAAILEPEAIRKLVMLNRDIFLRTIALIGGFYWFNEASLREGADILAANGVLLQFIYLSAYFLDAYANVTESVTGKTYGAKNWPALRRAFILSSEQALIAGALLSIGFAVFGHHFVALITTDPATRAAASPFILWCALVPLMGMPSWQMDGLMIGATRGPLMRNAMIAALVIYLIIDFILRPAFGAHGLWAAFLFYYIARALTQLPGWWGIKRDLQASAPTASDS